MKNWAVDDSKWDKNSDQYYIWQLEQLINYGLDGNKIKKSRLLKYWDQLEIDPDKKAYLAFLLNRINA